MSIIWSELMFWFGLYSMWMYCHYARLKFACVCVGLHFPVCVSKPWLVLNVDRGCLWIDRHGNGVAVIPAPALWERLTQTAIPACLWSATFALSLILSSPFQLPYPSTCLWKAILDASHVFCRDTYFCWILEFLVKVLHSILFTLTSHFR